MIRLITWNVNSIRTRLERLLSVLDRHKPDIVCLQEIKVIAEKFPTLDLKQAGYYSSVYGQKTYNGVAILSRIKPENVRTSMEDDVDDPQARLISADINGLRVFSIYVPNGSTVGSEKWKYKIDWLARLDRFLETTANPADKLALCGDFNVAPDDKDVRNPEAWRSSVLSDEDGRKAFGRLLKWGFVDVFREVHPEGGIYSWWDYRRLGFPKNDGLRIDAVLATPPLAKRLKNAEIDRAERKGKRPSDHAPVIVDFEV